MSSIQRNVRAALARATGAAMVGAALPATNAQTTTLARLQEGRRSLFNWLSPDLQDIVKARTGYDASARSEMYSSLENAFGDARDGKFSLFASAGLYQVGEQNMPFKQSGAVSALLDCYGIGLIGEGPATTFATYSEGGADVFNLNGLKSFFLENLGIEATLTASSGSGSNAISVTNGWDRLEFRNIWATNMPYVDKTTYLDGGKGLTLQPGTPSVDCGSLLARGIFVKGCVYGFGLEVDLVNFLEKRRGIDVEMIASDCHEGVIVSAGAASGPVTDGANLGLSVKAHLIDCQKSVVLSRAHGVGIRAHISTTKSAADRRKNPSGGAWASSTEVSGLVVAYAKNSQVEVTGDVGQCDYKARIGGASAGSSGLVGATSHSVLHLDLSGTAATADIAAIDSGGNVCSKTLLSITTSTTSAALPDAFYTVSNENTVQHGQTMRLSNPSIAGPLNFAYDGGRLSYNNICREDLTLWAQQTGASSAGINVFGVKSHTGTKLFAIRNDGYIASDGRITASGVTGLTAVLPICRMSDGEVVGYAPLYGSYS